MPRAMSVGTGQRSWGLVQTAETYLGVDPGGERLRGGVAAVATWLGAIGAALLLGRHIGAFRVDTAEFGADLTNHFATLVVAMIGSTVALTAGFTVTEPKPLPRLVTSLLGATGLFAGIALAIAVKDSRTTTLALLIIVPSVGALFRRLGPRGFATSFTVHVGYLVGALTAAQIGGHGLGKAAGLIAVSAAAAYLVGMAFLRGHGRAPLRMRRSYRARARVAATLIAQLTRSEADDPRRAVLKRRLRRQMVRLNETSLVLDVQLAGSDGAGAHRVRTAIFEHERALASLAALAYQDAQDRLPAALRNLTGAIADSAVCAARRGRDADDLTPDLQLAREHDERSSGTDVERIEERYVQAARAIALARDVLRQPDLGPDSVSAADPGTDLHRRVPLIGGWLPGTAIVNAVASSSAGHHWRDRIRLAVPTRVGIQLAVALTVAVLIGNALSPTHVLWAVVAVYVTFLGNASDHEQLTKAGFRVLGTIAGVLAGDAIAHQIGSDTTAVLIVVGTAVFLMTYLAKVNYGLVVFAATIGVAQFYDEAGELTGHLLATRVGLTAMGAGVAIVVGQVVLPLRTVQAATLATTSYLQALADVMDDIEAEATRGGVELATTRVRLEDHGYRQGASATTLTTGRRTGGSQRLLDASFHTASAALRPLARSVLGAPRSRCARSLRDIEITHQLSRVALRTDMHLYTAAELHAAASSAARAADLARLIAENLNGPAATRAEGTPVAALATTGLSEVQAEVEGIEASLMDLAALRRLVNEAGDVS